MKPPPPPHTCHPPLGKNVPYPLGKNVPYPLREKCSLPRARVSYITENLLEEKNVPKKYKRKVPPRSPKGGGGISLALHTLLVRGIVFWTLYRERGCLFIVPDGGLMKGKEFERRRAFLLHLTCDTAYSEGNNLWLYLKVIKHWTQAKNCQNSFRGILKQAYRHCCTLHCLRIA